MLTASFVLTRILCRTLWACAEDREAAQHNGGGATWACGREGILVKVAQSISLGEGETVRGDEERGEGPGRGGENKLKGTKETDNSRTSGCQTLHLSTTTVATQDADHKLCLALLAACIQEPSFMQS